MKPRNTLLLLLASVVVNVPGGSQIAECLPALSLTISAEKNPAPVSAPILIRASERNISQHEINASRSTNPGRWYQMSVMRDGQPVEETEEYRRIRHPKDDSNLVGGTLFGVLKPGARQAWEVPLSAYFDFSRPGHYQIRFSKILHEGEPEEVTVPSNTVDLVISP